MKKALILLLCLATCVSPLASCKGEDTTAAESTAPITTAYDYTKIPEVIEPHENKTVSSDELGYKAAVVSNTEKYWVADAKANDDGSITVTSYNPGTTVITV